MHVISTANDSTRRYVHLENGTGLRNCTVKGLTGVLSAVSYGTKQPNSRCILS